MIKLYLVLLTISCFIGISEYKAQNLTNQEKEMIIASLSDSSSSTQLGALFKIIEYKIEEASDSIERKFWNFDRSIQTIALRTLHELNAPNTYDFALSLSDTLDTNPSLNSRLGVDVLHEKITITNVLIEFNDYSTVPSVFAKIERDRPNFEDEVIEVLYKLVSKETNYKAQAISELEFATQNSTSSNVRIQALSYLDETNNPNIINLITQMFINDKEASNRWFVLDEYFSKYNDMLDLQGILQTQLYADTTLFIRNQIAKVLLFGVGGLSNYKFVDGYHNSMLGGNGNSALGWIIASYLPSLSDTTAPISTMFDTLTSYTTQSFGYEWLKNETYKTELLTKLTNAKTKLTTGDSLGCRTEVASFQNSVNQVYQDSTGSYPKYVSDAGYKFMYHYAQYILDRLPEAPIVEGLPVKLEDSQGNKKQQGDKIDHNTKEKIK